MFICVTSHIYSYVCQDAYSHMNMCQSSDAEGSLDVHAPSHPSVLQCITVSVLQCVAVCCSVLQCVAVCCSVLQCVAVCCSVLQCVALCCSVLQCVAVCCSVLHKGIFTCVA